VQLFGGVDALENGADFPVLEVAYVGETWGCLLAEIRGK
jgi:hypothetical protein